MKFAGKVGIKMLFGALRGGKRCARAGKVGIARVYAP